MQFRNSFAAGLILASATVAPLAASAQTMMLAPLPPPRPIDLAVAPALDPDAALRSSAAARDRVDRQQIVMQRADRDVPMPRAVPWIMAPVQP